MKKWLACLSVICLLMWFSAANAADKKFMIDGNELISVKHQTQEAQNKLSFDINFPKLSDQKFNALVKEMIDKEVTRFRTDVKEISQYMSKEEREMPGFNQLRITYQVISDAQTAKFVSILFAVESNLLGSAHPNMTHQVLNFDFKTGQMITLKQLFKPNSNYIALLNDYCAEQLSKKINQTADEIKESSALKYDNWNIKSTGLLITFDEFPRVLGPITVLVPYKILKPLLLPESSQQFIKGVS